MIPAAAGDQKIVVGARGRNLWQLRWPHGRDAGLAHVEHGQLVECGRGLRDGRRQVLRQPGLGGSRLPDEEQRTVGGEGDDGPLDQYVARRGARKRGS